MISKGNLYLGNHLDYFGTKFRSMDAKVLFRSFRAKIIQSTTATTSIAIRVANRLRIKRKIAILRYCHDSPSLAEGVRGWVICHCEANRRFAEAIQNKKCGLPRLAFASLAMTKQNNQNFNTKEHK